MEEKKQKLLLHSCCGPCSTACVERLVDRYDLTVYFYNPNITNEGEYAKRLAAEKQFIDAYNEKLPPESQVKLVEGPYDPERYLEAVRGLEDAPENGERCTVCFRTRMEQAAEYAGKEGLDLFTTTLTVSPHKNSRIISAIGHELQEKTGAEYLDENFKKKDGFRRSTEMSREYGLYRQNFCGCVFSERPGAGADDPELERGPIR